MRIAGTKVWSHVPLVPNVPKNESRVSENCLLTIVGLRRRMKLGRDSVCAAWLFNSNGMPEKRGQTRRSTVFPLKRQLVYSPILLPESLTIDRKSTRLNSSH